LAIRTISHVPANLTRFFAFLQDRGVDRLSCVTQGDFDSFLATLLDDSIRIDTRHDELIEVRRLWVYRSLLPVEHRFPDAVPWDDEEISDLVGKRDYTEENRTPRIPEATMASLLSWAIRFVEDFAGDILTAHERYLELCNRNPDGRRAGRSPRMRRTHHHFRGELLALIESYRQRKVQLPGRRNEAGVIVPDYQNLGRLLHCQAPQVRRHQKLLDAAILEIGISDGAFVHDRVTGLLDGSAWRDRPITYVEAPELARLLSTACFIVISYLSGMRPGESLNLTRGCAIHDPITGLDFVHGRKFKDAVDSTGAKKPEGEDRSIPWTVIPIVVQAIHVLEGLHDAPMLFPNTLGIGGTVHLRTRAGKARHASAIIDDISAFIDWVNGYCDLQGRPDVVPPDPNGRLISPSRFRRTLAWFIWHKPRGPVAAALQYGHVHVRITQGYAGTYDSGFPDDYGMEEFLGRLARFAEDEQRLREGEHVSGPAVKMFCDRTGAVAARFAGRIISTNRQAHAALNSPELQVFHGRAMVCVFNPAKALCQLSKLTDDDRRTPDLTDCRPECQNIARTDRDIETLREDNAILAAEAEDPLAPEPRRMRARRVMEGKASIIAEHEVTRVTSEGLTHEP